MNKKLSLLLFSGLLLSLGLFFALTNSRQALESPASPGLSPKVTVLDSQGRQVTVNCPPQRVVVLSQYIAEQPDLVLGRQLKPEIQEKLQQAGIPYMCIYGYKVKELPQEIRLLGQIFQQEARAEEYARFIEGHWQTVRERVENLPPEKKPKVYWESSQENYSTFGENSGAGPLIRWAGGLNIAAGKEVAKTKGNPKVNAEWVLEKNPDLIIKYVGRNMTGWDRRDLEKLRQIRQEIMCRPGLKETNAVKNGRVYLVFDTVTCAPRGRESGFTRKSRNLNILKEDF